MSWHNETIVYRVCAKCYGLVSGSFCHKCYPAETELLLLAKEYVRLRALNAELVGVLATIQRALDCAACMLCDAVEDRPIKASELTDIAGGLTVHAQTVRAAIAKANAEGGQTDDTGTGEELRCR